jgi:hypothetical protein
MNSSANAIWFCRRLGLLALVLAFLGLNACNLLRRQSASTPGPSVANIILSNSIFMDRTGNGDTATLQFKTSANAVCRIAYYAQDPNRTPTMANPTVQPCSNQNQPRQTFVENLSGLRQDTLYFLNIYTWVPPASEATASMLTIRESSDSSSMIIGDASASFNDLMVARLDVPLMSAEVFHHVPDHPITAGTVKTQLMQQLGCQRGVPSSIAAFRSASPTLGVQNLSTRDFAAANAIAHPDYPERLQLSYQAVNTGMNQWSLIFQSSNKDFLVPVQPISQLVSVEMESANITSFDTPQLMKAADIFTLDTSKPLKFSWSVANTLLSPSYLTIQIGNPDSPNALYCVFNANSGSGSIDPSYLQNIDDGQQDILVKLISNQLWVKEGWLVAISDWRSGRISK